MEFVKMRDSHFGSDNSNNNTNHPAATTALNRKSISKRKKSSDLTSRNKLNE